MQRLNTEIAQEGHLAASQKSSPARCKGGIVHTKSGSLDLSMGYTYVDESGLDAEGESPTAPKVLLGRGV